MLVEESGDAAGFSTARTNLACCSGEPMAESPASSGPDGGDEGADLEAVGGDLVGHAADVVVGGVGIGVGVEQEDVDPFELLAVDFRVGGEFEHPVKELMGVGRSRVLFRQIPGHMALWGMG